MNRFRKKPVEVEALLWTGENHDELTNWTDGVAAPFYVGMNPEPAGLSLFIDKSDVHVTFVDPIWVIREPDGSGFYPCKPDAFDAAYEKVES